MYYIILFIDGTMSFSTNKPGKARFYEKDAKFFRVDGELTVADISEVWSGNGWLRGIFPERLKGKITEI